eukprot:189419_1
MTLKNTIIGSFCVLLSELCFATNDAIVKLSNLTICQLMVGRFSVQFVIAILWWNFKQPVKTINWYGDHPYIFNIWIRGFTYSFVIITSWYAVIRLPLGDMYCIFEQSPLIIALMASIFLKEKLPKLTPIIVILSIVGITFLAQPTFLL